MPGKSAAQRVIEFIAVLAVIGCMVPVAIAVWGHFYKREPKPNPATVAAPPVVPPGPPQRERVDSIDKLPKTYPAIADVTTPRSASADSRLDALRASTKIWHLNAYVGNGVHLSPDGQMAVVYEATPANTTRLALWNVGTGKLLRFLSGEEGKESREYQGEENANFGVKVDFDQFREGMFSPDGKKFVACQGIGGVESARFTYLWDVASGKLLWQTAEPTSQAVLLFPSPEFLVVGSAVSMREYAWRRIDAATGESELLRPPAANEGPTTEGAAFQGQIACLRNHALATIDVATRQLLIGPTDNDAKSRPGYRHLWYSRDGKQVLGFDREQEASLDVWDLPSHKLVRSVKLAFDGTPQPQQEVYPAPEANLVGNRSSLGTVDFFDVKTGKRSFSLRFPFRGAPLKGITDDAKRFLIQTDQESLLVVDFTAGLPEGNVDLTDLLGSGKLAATR